MFHAVASTIVPLPVHLTCSCGFIGSQLKLTIMRTILLALSFIVSGIMVNAQSGVYLTYDDFENNRLTYATDAPSEENKIRFNEFIEKPFIIVKHNGEKVHVFKDE